jgi:hypothetical protein
LILQTLFFYFFSCYTFRERPAISFAGCKGTHYFHLRKWFDCFIDSVVVTHSK